jgi:hypothetical protein
MEALSDFETCVNTLVEISHSKLVFMSGEGKIRVVNSQMGHWKDNCWYSNHSYTNPITYDKKHGVNDYNPKLWTSSAKLLDL